MSFRTPESQWKPIIFLMQGWLTLSKCLTYSLKVLQPMQKLSLACNMSSVGGYTNNAI